MGKQTNVLMKFLNQKRKHFIEKNFKMQKFIKQKKETAIATVFSNKENCQAQTENFKVSFQYLDTTQKYGSGFKIGKNAGCYQK